MSRRRPALFHRARAVRRPVTWRARVALAAGATVAAFAAGCSPVSERVPSSLTEATPTTVAAGAPGAGELPADTTAPAVASQAAPQWRALGEPGVGGWITGLAIDPLDPAHYLAGGDMLGVAVSTDAGASWKSTVGLAAAEVSTFTFNPARPGEVWVATMGGPYLSTDGGQTWSARRAGMPPTSDASYSAPIEKVLLDPAQPGHLLAFGGSHREWESLGKPAWGAVWESVDDGATWARISTVADGPNLLDAVRLADGAIEVVALNGGIYRSADGGHSWQRQNTGLPHNAVRALAAHPTDANQVWAALGAHPGASATDPGGIYHSSDGGRSWRLSSTGLPRRPGAADATNYTDRYHTVAVSPSQPNILYTSNLAWGAEAVYRSDDGGGSWQQATAANVNRPTTAYATPIAAEALAVGPTDAGQVLVGNSEFIVGTSDGGARWRDLTSDVQADGTFLGRGFSGLVANRVVFAPDGREVILCGFDGANPLMRAVGEAGWSRPLVSHDAWGGCSAAAYSPVNPARRYVLLGQNGVFGGIAVIEGSGRQFTLAAGAAAGLPDAGSPVGNPGAVAALVGPDGGETVVVTLDGTPYRSLDGGRTWSAGQAGLALGDLATDPAIPGRLYAAGSAGVAVSDDAGASFQLLVASPAAVERLRFDTASKRLYATVWRKQGAGIWRFAAGQWEHLLVDDMAFDVAADPTVPTHLVAVANDHPFHDVVQSRGALVSWDDGATWTTANEGLPLARASTVAFDPAAPGRVVIGSFGRGFFEANLRAPATK